MLANRDQEIIVFKKLNPKDITITPFKTYKEWNVTTDNSSSYGITIKNGVYDATIGIDCKLNKTKISENHLNYISIKRNFYDEDKFSPHITTGRCSEFTQTRELNGIMKIISIPEITFGEQIKPGSVILYKGNNEDTYYDDGNGNLYSQSNNNLVSSDGLLSYINFNELYYLLPDTLYSGNIKDVWNFKNTMTASNIYVDDGIYGTGISLNANESYCQLLHTDELNFTIYDDYTISFWIKLPDNQQVVTLTDFDIISKYGNNDYAGMPYRIYYDSIDNKLKYKISDTIVTTVLTSSIELNDSTYHHIVCQKSGSVNNDIRSGSYMNLYIDGVLNQTGIYLGNGQIHNTSDIFIGTNTSTEEDLVTFISASIDELRIYNKALSSTEVNNLYNLPNNSNRVGNIFYEYGKIVITRPMAPYSDMYNFEFLNTNFEIYPDFNLFFKSQHTIYEREILCTIKDTEFNYTMNDSIRQTENPKDDRMKWFVNDTTQSFSPYITTVGLYDDNQQLLAIAKLARPIRSEKNSDLTIVCRIDM